MDLNGQNKQLHISCNTKKIITSILWGSTETVVDMTLMIINPCVPFRMWLLPHTAQQSGKCFAFKYEARLKACEEY